MLFLTAVLLGSAAASLRSLAALVAVAVAVPACFAAAALVGPVSFVDLGLAVLGVNAGVATILFAGAASTASLVPARSSN